MDFDAAGLGHFLHAGERFEGAEQNASGTAFGLAGDIEAVVVAVDEVNVGVARRPEQNRGAGGVAGGGVGGGIVLAEVGFDFDDAGGETEIWAPLPVEPAPCPEVRAPRGADRG